MAVKKSLKRKLTERADKEMSRFIRLFHSDNNGYCTCVTCGVVKYWEKDGMQMGHFMNKGNGATAVRWIPHNCFPQCFSCNCNSGPVMPSTLAQAAPIRYTRRMLDYFGEATVDDLDKRKFSVVKYKDWEIQEIGDLYKEFADQLKKEKGL